MASYRYTTELYKDGKLIGCGDCNSLKRHIGYTFSMVRDRLTKEEVLEEDKNNFKINNQIFEISLKCLHNINAFLGYYSLYTFSGGFT